VARDGRAVPAKAGTNPPRRRTARRQQRSRWGIAGLIFIANFAGVVVLILGTLLFNELRTGLTQSRVDTLRTQALTVASVLAEAAVPEDVEPRLDEARARAILRRLFREPGGRLRLFDLERRLLADSAILYAEVNVKPLPPLGLSPPDLAAAAGEAVTSARVMIQGAFGDPQEALASEVGGALQGIVTARERFDENGERVVSVSVPIQRVRRVVGVLTLESSDVNTVIEQERRALYPFIAAAIVVAAVSASLLAWAVARPLRQLSTAADRVESGATQVFEDRGLSVRRDELGELALALSRMTSTLQERIDANERFAADVAHEIKNPLAAIRNAAELLPRAQGDNRAKLEKIILGDASRVDRLITDISNASRLDAELARSSRERVDIATMVRELATTYTSIGHSREVTVRADLGASGIGLDGQSEVLGGEDAFGRVLTNLLDNALSFSPPGTTITIRCISRNNAVRVEVDDCGPGIPEEAIEKVFARFYTHRPDGQAVFGTHSGLGLSIARQIVEAHGGRLTATNRRDSDGTVLGARFTMLLPLARG
jgi:two-component system, OmpR family, sensor histidine kinase ChvG